MTAAWITELEAVARAEFARTGLPRADRDGWRHTPLPDLFARLGTEPANLDVVCDGPDGWATKLDVLYAAGAPDWVRALQTRPAKGPLWHLCNAHMGDGVELDVPAGAQVPEPIVITLTGHDGQLLITRTAIRIGAGARVTIVERHVGTGTYWNNRLSQVLVEPGASLTHIRLQENAADAVYTQTTDVDVAQGGSYKAFNFVTGAALSRMELRANLLGPGAHAHAHGLSLLRGAQLCDHTITIAHRAPDCTSAQHLGFVLDDQARGVFQGRVRVDPGAQKTDAHQRSRAVLLSDAARMAVQPELEIFADDVQCAHGATCGALDEAALFYLRARGVPEAAARQLLLEGFASEVLDDVPCAATREVMQKKVAAWLTT